MAETVRPDVTLHGDTDVQAMDKLIAYYGNRSREYRGIKSAIALVVCAQLNKTRKALKDGYSLTAKGYNG